MSPIQMPRPQQQQQQQQLVALSRQAPDSNVSRYITADAGVLHFFI